MILIETRVEKNRKNKKIKRDNKILGVSINVLTILVVFFSVYIWFYLYRSQGFSELMKWLQTFYLMDIGLFIMIAFTGKVTINVVKNLIKLAFSVWIVIFILSSTLKQGEQIGYTIFITFLVGYMEVLTDLYISIKEGVQSINNDKFKIIEKETMIRLTMQITIIIVSLLHMFLAYFLLNPLKDIIR
ncbi:hypothetical protein [Aneurinibacillus soli]|uniref:hypothetical protein n=1 Tax=Aneurinibacillus soli TaxID=1500254 RepID=UPI000BBADA8B|nr:hypothetical protein [Aneurinibacillus soli]